MSEQQFACAINTKYRLHEKEELGYFCKWYKSEYDEYDNATPLSFWFLYSIPHLFGTWE